MDIRLYSSVFLVNGKKEVLLVREGKEKVHGLWNLPGGNVEQGEEFLAAAIREAKEETGLDVEPSHLMKIFCGENVGSLHFIFLAKRFSGNLHVSDANILEVQWVPIAKLKTMEEELLHSYKFRSILESFEKGNLTDADIINYQT